MTRLAARGEEKTANSIGGIPGTNEVSVFPFVASKREADSISASRRVLGYVVRLSVHVCCDIIELMSSVAKDEVQQAVRSPNPDIRAFNRFQYFEQPVNRTTAFVKNWR